jgi:hypothetical protein
MSPVEMPRKYSQGKAASTRLALRTYGGGTIYINQSANYAPV